MLLQIFYQLFILKPQLTYHLLKYNNEGESKQCAFDVNNKCLKWKIITTFQEQMPEFAGIAQVHLEG